MMLTHGGRLFRVLLNRPDVRANPLRAGVRRWRWRRHWRSPGRPFVTPFDQAMQIELAHTGSSALVYYQGYSEPGIAQLFRSLLRPGMVCLDIGAHVGEYTLLAAAGVGPTGHVHSFEAQQELCDLVLRNAKRNGFADRVTVNRNAVAEHPGQQVSFHVPVERSGASLLPPDPANAAHAGTGQVVNVTTITLDNYIAQHGGRVDLIKMDIEGAEPLAFRGACDLLARPAGSAPTWLFEYSPRNCARFELEAKNMLALLREHGYAIERITDDGLRIDLPENQDSGEPHDTCNLLASKRQ